MRKLYHYKIYLIKNICRGVDEAFVRLHEQGIIYRAVRPINWCCTLKSAISDAEVEVLSIAKKTSLKIPSYPKPIDFGLIYKYSYPIKGIGKYIYIYI